MASLPSLVDALAGKIGLCQCKDLALPSRFYREGMKE